MSAASAGPGTCAERSPLRAAKIILSIVGIVIALVWFFPVYWMLNSLVCCRTWCSARTRRASCPIGGSFDNFVTVFQGGTRSFRRWG